ncbi:MAG: glycerophosphodiester phosphodiesterase [Pleomorphochaeta sp.]
MINKLTIHSGANNTKANSIEYLLCAINFKHSYIEVDVRVSLDNICFLAHDNLINNIELDSLNFNDAKIYDEQLITLDQAISFAKKYNTKLNIDIKDDKYIEKIISCIEENDFVNNCVISGTHLEGAKLINKINKNIRIIINFEEEYYDNIEYYVNEYKKIILFGININYLLLDSPLFFKLRELNFPIFTWTVDNLKDFEICKRNEVFNITTNYPNLFY